MADLKDLKVWWNKQKTEKRVYARTVDGREGCSYVTGNHFQAKGQHEGNLTDEEWAEAKTHQFAGKWVTIDELRMRLYYASLRSTFEYRPLTTEEEAANVARWNALSGQERAMRSAYNDAIEEGATDREAMYAVDEQAARGSVYGVTDL